MQVQGCGLVGSRRGAVGRRTAHSKQECTCRMVRGTAVRRPIFSTANRNRMCSSCVHTRRVFFWQPRSTVTCCGCGGGGPTRLVVKAGTAVTTGADTVWVWAGGADGWAATPTADVLTARCKGAAGDGATGVDPFSASCEVVAGVGTAGSVAGAPGGANSCATLIWVPKDITRYSDRKGPRPRKMPLRAL